MAERIESRLDRLGLTPDVAAKRAGLPVDVINKLLAGTGGSPRGTRLRKLAEVLECSISYLVGLDPDIPPPPELLEDDQGNFGLLAADQEALLRFYGALDWVSKQALLRVAQKMAGAEVTPLPPPGKRGK